MTLAKQMQDDVDKVYLNTNEHAESIIHHPAGGSQATIKAIVERQSYYMEAPSPDGLSHILRAIIWISASVKISNYRKDTFELDGDGKKWAIEGGALLDTSGMHRLDLFRPASVVRSGEDYYKVV